MRNASAVAYHSTPPSRRPRLTLVPDRAQDRRAPARQRVAALLSGLISGFVLAALATVAGGGRPGGALAVSATLGLVLVGVLVHSRRVTVRARRLARVRRAHDGGDRVVSLDAARAA